MAKAEGIKVRWGFRQIKFNGLRESSPSYPRVGMPINARLLRWKRASETGRDRVQAIRGEAGRV